MSELQYEPTVAARPFVVERDGDTTRVVLHMRGVYAPIPRWVGDLDMLTLVVAPAWWIGTLLIRTCLRLPKPPRAVFEFEGDRVRMTLRDVATGATTDFDWPRSAVLEMRANRYGRGLWIDVAGQVKNTYFTDLSRETIERLEAALISALDATGEAEGLQHNTEETQG